MDVSIDRNGNGKCAGKKRLSEKHPELAKMVVHYRKMIDRKTHRSLSYRTISRRLKEEHNLVVSHNTVHRILDDIVLMKREQRNRKRRKLYSKLKIGVTNNSVLELARNINV